MLGYKLGIDVPSGIYKGFALSFLRYIFKNPVVLKAHEKSASFRVLRSDAVLGLFFIPIILIFKYSEKRGIAFMS